MFGDIMEPTHLLFILVVALLVLGPKRLPEVGRTLGSGIRDFRHAISGELPDHHEPDPVESETETEQRHQPSATATAPAPEPDATPWYEQTVEPPNAERTVEPIDELYAVADEPDSTAHTPATEPEPSQPDVPATEPEHAVAQVDPPATEPEHAVARSASETRTEPGA